MVIVGESAVSEWLLPELLRLLELVRVVVCDVVSELEPLREAEPNVNERLEKELLSLVDSETFQLLEYDEVPGSK